MAYYDGYLLATDQDFLSRCGMAAEAEPPPLNFDWGVEHRYALASSPGFSDAYASALVAGVPDPGRDPSVISDAQILSAVQALAAVEAA